MEIFKPHPQEPSARQDFLHDATPHGKHEGRA
jgi:hypothetical protein